MGRWSLGYGISRSNLAFTKKFRFGLIPPVIEDQYQYEARTLRRSPLMWINDCTRQQVNSGLGPTDSPPVQFVKESLLEQRFLAH